MLAQSVLSDLGLVKYAHERREYSLIAKEKHSTHPYRLQKIGKKKVGIPFHNKFGGITGVSYWDVIILRLSLHQSGWPKKFNVGA